jgi:DNA-binding NtrC family response regulator
MTDRPRLLIVDDLREYRESLSRVLSGEFDIVTAADLEGAKAATDDTVSLALVDVRLSEDDADNPGGVRYLEWAQSTRPSLPVVMMSVYSTLTPERAKALGAREFLRKPIDVDALHELLRRLARESEVGPDVSER